MHINNVNDVHDTSRCHLINDHFIRTIYGYNQ